MPDGPGRVSAAPVDMSTSMTSPLGWVACAASSPSTSRSKKQSGRAGTPVPVPAQGQGTPFQPALVPPTDLPSLMQGVSDSYQVGHGPGSTGDVRITRVDNGGAPAYVVAIPGTESWSPSAGGQPRDLSANLGLVAGNPTAAAESVRAAMDAAGIPLQKQEEHVQSLNNSLAAAFTAKAAAISQERLEELMGRLETLEELLPESENVEIDESMVLDLSGHESSELEVVGEPDRLRSIFVNGIKHLPVRLAS